LPLEGPMKNKLSLLLFLLLQVLYISVAAQAFQWKRSIQPDLPSGWHTFTIPVELTSKTKPGYNDLRILAIGPKQDTTEVPYVLERSIPRKQKEDTNFSILNKTERDGRFYYTLALKDEIVTLNEIKLFFSEKNFDLAVTLEGSINQEEWFTLLKDYRITGIKNKHADFQFTTLITKFSNYKYYRLNYITPKDPVILNAQFDISMKQREGAWWEFKGTIQKMETLKKEKQTTCIIDLPEPLPVSLIHFYIKDSTEYIRPMSIRAIPWPDNITGTDEEKFIPVTSGMLNSFDKQQITFPELICKRLAITITNNDNVPLTIDSVKLKCLKKLVITRLPDASAYIMMYGNKSLPAPQYDLAEVLPKMELPDFGNITVGPEVRNLPEKPKSWWENNAWIYALMGLIVITLGGFTIKMMRKREL
jgi:hypothetical protein